LAIAQTVSFQCSLRLVQAGENSRFLPFFRKHAPKKTAMKQLNNLIRLGLLILAVSCSSGDNNEGVMNPPDNNPEDGNNDPVPGSVTYQEDIRIIVQSNCTSCHSNPPTYDDVRNAVNDRGLLSRINSSTAPMPPTGRLPLATRRIFEDWVDLGFPE